jgi:hypothetical protein
LGKISEDPVGSEEFVFDLATYLLTSARGCIEEPLLYGPLRLIEALSRLAKISEHAKCVKRDDFLLRAKKRIDENKYTVMQSEEEFTKFLDSLIKEFTSELKRRNSAD